MGSREVVDSHNVLLFSCCKVGSDVFPAFHVRSGSQKSIFTFFIFNWSIIDLQSCWCSAKWLSYMYISVQFSSVSKSCLTLCDPMDCSMPGFPVLYCVQESLLKFMSIESVMQSNHLILWSPGKHNSDRNCLQKLYFVTACLDEMEWRCCLLLVSFTQVSWLEMLCSISQKVP